MVIFKHYHGKKDVEPIKSDDGIAPANFEAPDGHRTFVSGPGVEVHSVKKFLPNEVATRWRETMSYEWRRMKFNEGAGNLSNGLGAWKYATNNDGSGGQGNEKTRNLENILSRNATAQTLKKMGYFSYSKFELDPSHPLVKEIENTFSRDVIMNTVKRIISTHQEHELVLSSKLSDLFVTHYTTGDFLSAHNDGVSGTWAFVVSLMESPGGEKDQGWEEDFGGQLRFSCPDGGPTSDSGWCEMIRPEFNSALVFRTRPVGPMHEVLPVTWRAAAQGFRRFGITGWYMEESDQMSSAAKAERDKMRARTDTTTGS